MLLDRPRRNAIFNEIVLAGRDPRDFDLSENTFTHRSTGSQFYVANQSSGYLVRYTVGDSDAVERLAPVWDMVLILVPEWVEGIDGYAAMPDLWAELGNGRELAALASARDTENALFTDAERAEIRKHLNEIRHYAKATGIEGQELEELESRVLYLEEASGSEERTGCRWRSGPSSAWR